MYITKEIFIDRHLKPNTKFNTRIKKYLLKFGLKENKCEICGLKKWNDKELTCQIHHINGNRNDNRLENLQMLCPNCHSQTENYMNKNTFIYHIKETVCINCGKHFISKYGDGKFCSKTCSKEYRVKTRRLEISNYSKEYLQELCEKCNTLSEIGHIIHKSKETVKKHLILHGLFEDFLRKTDSQKARILQYDIDGNFIKEWLCASDAEETLKIHHVCAVCKGKRKTAGGYVWKYKEENTEKKLRTLSVLNTSKPVSILQYDMEGNFLKEYTTIKEASEFTNTCQSSISRCLKNKNQQANNFIWKYKEDIKSLKINTDNIKYGNKKPVVMYDIEGNILAEFPSIREASKATTITCSNISQCLNGSMHTAGGYIWKYKNYNKVSINTDVQNKPFPSKIHQNKVGVLQYDLEGNFIKEYETITSAAKENNLLTSHISSCVNGTRNRAGDYMWKIKSGEIEYKINAFKQKPKRARKVVKYNENGEFICEYETIENAVKDANISRGTLMKYIANKIKSPNGFIWRFKDNNNLQNIDVSNFVSKSKQSIPVLKCNLQGDVLQEFPTIASASKETGVSRTHIYNSLAGRGRKIDDYNWKFKY